MSFVQYSYTVWHVPGQEDGTTDVWFTLKQNSNECKAKPALTWTGLSPQVHGCVENSAGIVISFSFSFPDASGCTATVIYSKQQGNKHVLQPEYDQIQQIPLKPVGKCCFTTVTYRAPVSPFKRSCFRREEAVVIYSY